MEDPDFREDPESKSLKGGPYRGLLKGIHRGVGFLGPLGF